MRSKTLLIGLIGIVIGVLLSTAVVFAGNLNPGAGPADPGSQMYTLQQIYTRLTGGGDATKMTTFTEPSSGPGTGTMHTLDEIYALALPARVPKTGQTTPYATGDDGDLEKGVTWPNPRFITGTTGVVTDTLTGLIWLQNANCANASRDWATALTDVASLNSAGTMNSNNCGDTSNGGSRQTDWRLPNVRELQSLIDYGRSNPVLPSGHPFTGVQSYYYWASTTNANATSGAWGVSLSFGNVAISGKTFTYYVWPVRGGQ